MMLKRPTVLRCTWQPQEGTHLVRELLARGAVSTALNEDGVTALNLAVDGAHIPVIRELLDADGSLIQRLDILGNSVLDDALFHGDRSTATFLLEKDADVHIGHPLHAAAKLGFTDFLQIFLDRGVRVNTSRSRKGYELPGPFILSATKRRRNPNLRAYCFERGLYRGARRCCPFSSLTRS